MNSTADPGGHTVRGSHLPLYGTSKYKVVDHVDMAIPEGKVTILTGPSGSGKKHAFCTLWRAFKNAGIVDRNRVKREGGGGVGYLSA